MIINVIMAISLMVISYTNMANAPIKSIAPYESRDL
jgi:hypothetical protein